MNKTNQNEIVEKSDKVKDFLPVTLFILLTFLLQAFNLDKASNLVISVFVSIFTFGVLSAMVKEKFGDRPELKPLHKKTGILSFFLFPIIGVAILHWYQIWHVDLRWALFFFFLIVYFFFLFRAVSTLHDVKMTLINTSGKDK